MRLTLEKLQYAFLHCGYDTYKFSTAWVLIDHAKKHGDIELREALELVRSQAYEVTVFIDQILELSDVDDVSYVIEKLISDPDYRFFNRGNCLKILLSWRSGALMRIVIEKQKAMNRTVFDLAQSIV